MKNNKAIWLALCFLVFTASVTAQQSDYDAVVGRYIARFKDIAVKEMLVYRIPASITLAQGILESGAGRSDLAVEANNHFGIKCHKGWTGKTFYKDDDAKNECFRKYESPFESYRDHSWFLTQRERYKGLFDLDVSDYKGWATGLKSAGYATNPAYAQLLVNTIEKYGLSKFDRADFAEAFGDSLKNLSSPAKQSWLKTFLVVTKGPGNRLIYENNRLQMIIAGEDDNIYVIARDFNLTVGQLLSYNDLPRATALKPGQIVYLEEKRRKGAAETHRVKKDDTLYEISQLYGIRMKLLCKRNDLQPGDSLRTGTLLELR